MGHPFSINIFYPDGNPENIRIVDKRNFTGKVFYISREYWKKKPKELEEPLKNPGIYILSGADESTDNDNLKNIYIGHADDLWVRIAQHAQHPAMGFWDTVVCVTGEKDFNVAHFIWMESHLVNQAIENDRSILKNRATPSKSNISQSDVFDVQKFLEEILQIFPAVEIDAFVEPAAASPEIDVIPDDDTLNVTHDVPVEIVDVSDVTNFDKEAKNKLKTKVLASFQNRENIKLLKRSQTTFYDESKTFHVCCTVSKNFQRKNKDLYWYTIGKRWFDFLRNGKKGYLIFCMEGKSSAVVLPFNDLIKLKEKSEVEVEDGEDFRMHVHINQEKEKFSFKLNSNESIDCSPYLFNID